MQYLSNILHLPQAADRAYPDAARDVWEIAVWDPTPLCLRLFCIFSPGHVLVYWLFLPISPSDPRPSTTILTTMVLAALLSTQLLALQNFSSRQQKDSALIHKEVAHEYDNKFVHPSLNKPVRDAGTQMIPKKYASAIPAVTTSPTVTYVNRGFKTSPNPNYAPHLNMNKSRLDRGDPVPRSSTTPNLHSTSTGMDVASDFSSPLRPTPTPAFRQPVARSSGVGVSSSTSSSTSTGDGGNLGVYSHARSPLRKQASANFVRERSPHKQEGSPLKRISTPGEAEGFRVRQHRRRDTGGF